MTMQPIAPWPLHWPDGWPRTPAGARRRWPAGDIRFVDSRAALIEQARLLGSRSMVISTDLETRNDGLPRAGQPRTADPGVAVWMEVAGRQRVIACDRYDAIPGNFRAIARSIEALRGLERWGTSHMVERAWSAFTALPPPRPWWDVLGLPRDAGPVAITAAFRELAKRLHPDAGGDACAFQALAAARDAGLRARAEAP